MSTIWGNPITFGGGSGGAELNIDYGTSAPSDTSKLWVPLANKPSAVELSPRIDAMPGSPTLKLSNTSTTSGGSVASVCAVNGNLWFYDSSTHNSGKSVLKYSPADGSLSLIGATYRTYKGMVQHNGAVYVLDYSTGSSSFSFTGKIATVTENGTVTSTGVSNSIIDDWSAPISDGTYIWYIGRSVGGSIPNSIYCYNPATNAHTQYLCGMGVYKPSKIAMVGKKIYFLCDTDGSSPWNSSLYSFDTESHDTTLEISNIYSHTNTLLTPLPLETMGGKLYAWAPDGTVYIIDPNTKSVTTVSSCFPFTIGSENYSPLSAVIDGVWYLRQPYSVANKYIGSLYEYKALMPLDNGKLCIIYDGITGAWKAVNGKDVVVGADPVQAYLGNSSGYADAVDAYLHNGANWVSLDGVSMTADMLNALATLGVT